MIKEFLKDQGQRGSWSFMLAAMYPEKNVGGRICAENFYI